MSLQRAGTISSDMQDGQFQDVRLFPPSRASRVSARLYALPSCGEPARQLKGWLVPNTYPDSYRVQLLHLARWANAMPEPQPPISERFSSLAAAWRDETRFSSSLADIIMNMNYQRIIGMGAAVVPLILAELRQQADHWFWALTAITGEDPVHTEHSGDLELMRADWLAWADDNEF